MFEKKKEVGHSTEISLRVITSADPFETLLASIVSDADAR